MTTEPRKLKEIIPTSIVSNGSQITQIKHSANNDVVIRYGNGKQFAETFNPDLQRICAENLERTFTGNAPTIAQLRDAYPLEQVRVWILAQLENLNAYAGAKNKMEPHQMMMLSDIILTEYYYLKASELLLFFFQFKAGKYGELYGSVDPLRVSSALKEFVDYRREMLFRIDSKNKQDERLKQQKDHEKTAITRSKYLRKKFVRSKHQFKIKSKSDPE